MPGMDYGFPWNSDDAEVAEVWTPPGWPAEAAIPDETGQPLTWAHVCFAHDWLVRHATCAAADDQAATGDDDATGYESEGDRCPCTYAYELIEARPSYMDVCRSWPGPICGSCWAASCECGYVFESVEDAHSRWPSGRLRCAGCAA